MNTLWGTLLYSLSIAIPATLLAALLAVPLAYAASRRRFTGRSVVDALILMPLVLPPTVVGYLLIVLFGRRGWIGQWLADATDGYSLLFRAEGGMVAAAVVAAPLLYLPAKAAFGSIEREMFDIARVNGASRWQTFWQVAVPIAWRGLASGLVLGFARALGEFGATVMVMGNLPGRPMTLPVLVYNLWEQGEPHAAVGPVLLLSAIALVLVVLFNRIPKA
ncbi:MAG TPA: molybdate ABC transporter permease subunit [Tepidisphaeraceae bacterium]|jgi:molybdate transport system permease protein|nr:molybdate ABC transporter permease subunit [Tepidisphaeraceae bacterium]